MLATSRILTTDGKTDAGVVGTTIIHGSPETSPPPPPMSSNTPCLSCGACCATYRISFYWGEADDAPGGWVPVAWTEKLTPHLRAMRGSNAAQPYCDALDGKVGAAVCCRIYEQRPSPCREFEPYGDDGSPDLRCQAARARHGLPPLAPRGG